MPRLASTASLALPWWASAGHETCSFCLQRYHYEVEYRCAACDRPLCPTCAVHVELEVVALCCPQCPDQEGEEG